MNTANKQSGFSVVEGVIAIVVVIVLGFIGWSVYNHYSSKPAKVSSQTTSPSDGQPSKETTSSTTATTQTAYLDIKEFGIKIPLDSSIADATYTVLPLSSVDPSGTQSINVTTKSLASASNNKCNLLEITQTVNQTWLGNPLVPNNTTVFKIGSYYYIFSGQQSLCSTDQKVNDLLHQQSATFGQDFKAAQPDN